MASCHYAKGFIWAFYLVLTTRLQITYSIDMNHYPHFTEAECHAHTQDVSNGDGHRGTPERVLAYCLGETGGTRGIGTRKISQGAFPEVVGLVRAVFWCER